VAKIEYRNLRKVFEGGTVAVDDLDLEIADGEFMVLVGPSGSGKTTVLRITAGLDEATSGSVLIGGSAVDRIPPMDRNIAMVFQNYALYPHMTVYDNMAFGLKRHKVKKQLIRARVEAAASMLGIEKGKVYPMDLFHAERHTDASNFRVDTNFAFVDCGRVIN
jgi:multiple sugar transport system ATP-binding protein